MILAWISEHGDYTHLVGVAPEKVADFEASTFKKARQIGYVEEQIFSNGAQEPQVVLRHGDRHHKIPRTWITRSQTQTMSQIQDELESFIAQLWSLELP